jgi:hypothetical protein
MLPDGIRVELAKRSENSMQSSSCARHAPVGIERLPEER